MEYEWFSSFGGRGLGHGCGYRVTAYEPADAGGARWRRRGIARTLAERCG